MPQISYKKMLLIVVASTLFFATKAQKRVSEHSIFSGQLDNDALQATDKYYTQGLFIQQVDPSLVKNPINHLFIQPKNSLNQYSFCIAQQMYTPYRVTNTKTEEMNYPYAGTLFLRSGAVSAHKGLGLKIESSFDIGVMGPASGAEETQIWFHRITSSPTPKGWKHQIKNAPIMNYNVNVEKSVARGNYSNLSLVSTVKAGTLHTNAKIGTKFEVQNFKGFYEVIDYPEKSMSTRKVNVGGYVKAEYHRMIYNALFTKELLTTSPNLLYQNHVPTKNIFEAYAGTYLQSKWMRLEYAFVFQTREITSTQAHCWSQIKLSIKLTK